MIVVSPPRLLKGINETMEDTIIPALETSYARGQCYAAIELIRDFRSMWDQFTELYSADNRSLVRLLQKFAKLAQEQRTGAKAAKQIIRALSAVDLRTGYYEKARHDNILLRAFLNDALVTLDRQKQTGAVKNLRLAIRRHLKAQLGKELKMESQTALARMSKG